MSFTEIYGFGRDGNVGLFGEVVNAWRGAMAIWVILEKRYLEPLPMPLWMSPTDYKKNGYSRTHQMPNGKDDPLKQIWDLFEDGKVSRVDKIVLGTTFDKVIVMRENIEETAKAFDEFKGETSLKEQANILRKMLEDDSIIAVGWNQTSVNGDTWGNYNYNEETEESFPYNILTQTDHFDLYKDVFIMEKIK